MKIRYSILASLALLASFSVSITARQLTPQEALSRVFAGGNNSARRMASQAIQDPALSISPQRDPGFVSLYVFENQNEGFMIVSADDVSVPLLGYSDTGKIKGSDISPELNYWLQYYAAEIQIAAANKNQVSLNKRKEASTRPEREAIAPLTVSKWNQGAPYNDDCPMDGKDRSVTGCVATAMAQAMYFHQWPEKGQGSNSYKWNGTSLSVDFGETTYDWANMTPTYDSNSTAEQKAAVANLMYSCGVSVNMDYSSDESGASSLSMGPALYKYFNYDKGMSQPQRYFYGLIDWENIIYDQLQKGLPVLYGGQSYEGGHEFICDGYSSDGYFHFNWGWGGMSDGYFLLSALDPMDQGIGGSASQSGFDFDQGILINMMPPVADSKVPVLIYCYGTLESPDSSVTLGNDFTVKSSEGFFNFACAEIEGYMGLKLTDEEGNVTYIKEGTARGFAAITGYESYKIKLPADLSDGTYTATPVFMEKGAATWNDILCPLSGNSEFTLNVSDGVATVTATSPASLTVTDFTLNTPIYLDKDFSTTISFTNTGTAEYFGEYNLFLFDQNGNEVASSADLGAIDLQPGETQTVNYVTKFASEYQTESGNVSVEPGQYILAMYTHFTNEQIFVYDDYVNVQEAPETTTLQISNFTVNGGDTNIINTSDVKFTGTVTCEEGYFSGQLEVAVFKSGTTSTDLIGKSEFLFLNAGDSSSFTADVNLDVDHDTEERYFAIVYQDKNTSISNPLYFNVSTAGIISAEANERPAITIASEMLIITDNEGIESIKIYDINGLEIADVNPEGQTEYETSINNLNPGAYIVTVTSSSGASAVTRFIK